jgi:YD repeat-containing protein
VHSFTYGDGNTAPVQTYTRQRDTDGRIASYTLNGKLQSIGYDIASQVWTITDSANLNNVASYGYDNLSHLNSFTQGAISQGYTYDADGNRATQTLGSTTSTYTYVTGSNKLATLQTGASTQSFLQDANGATTVDATRQYGYDLRGRLIQVTTGLGVINYEVNALGLRVRKQVLYTDTNANANTDTLYHYDAQGHLIGESPTGSTQFTREYIYLGDQPVAVMQ